MRRRDVAGDGIPDGYARIGVEVVMMCAEDDSPLVCPAAVAAGNSGATVNYPFLRTTVIGDDGGLVDHGLALIFHGG
jgi:hypothetical protein